MNEGMNDEWIVQACICVFAAAAAGPTPRIEPEGTRVCVVRFHNRYLLSTSCCYFVRGGRLDDDRMKCSTV